MAFHYSQNFMRMVMSWPPLSSVNMGSEETPNYDRAMRVLEALWWHTSITIKLTCKSGWGIFYSKRDLTSKTSYYTAAVFVLKQTKDWGRSSKTRNLDITTINEPQYGHSEIQCSRWGIYRAFLYFLCVTRYISTHKTKLEIKLLSKAQKKKIILELNR